MFVKKAQKGNAVNQAGSHTEYCGIQPRRLRMAGNKPDQKQQIDDGYAMNVFGYPGG